MITAVDTNVFMDQIVGEVNESVQADAAMVQARREGILVISMVVYAELSTRFTKRSQLNAFLKSCGCVVEALDEATAHLAGRYFLEYRKRGGERVRILPDFLIAAHAELNADRILTRDGRFFGESFPNLVAVTPAEITTRSS